MCPTDARAHCSDPTVLALSMQSSNQSSEIAQPFIVIYTHTIIFVLMHYKPNENQNI